MNEGVLVFTIIGGFVVVAATMVILTLQYLRRVKRELQAYADSHGCTFSAKDTLGILKLCKDLKEFRQGSSHKVSLLVFGQRDGVRFCFFTHEFETGSGDSTTHYNHRWLLLEGALTVPSHLWVRPENFVDRIAEMMGFDDIDFEFNQFNDMYFVKADDKKTAYDFFGREVMESLVHDREKYCFEARGPLFIFSLSNLQFSVSRFDFVLGAAFGLLGKLDPLAREKFLVRPVGKATGR
ncbi:MAG: hypothetical protein WC712_08910 [Candidatus Brocadiia bacterium]